MKLLQSHWRIAFAFLFIIILNKEVNGQIDLEFEHKVSGTILDKETGDPLPFVPVYIFRKDSLVGKAQTDLDGHFELNTNEHGDLTLKIKYIGYEDFEQAISFNNSFDFSKPIRLKESLTMLGGVEIYQGKFQKLTGTATEVGAEEIELENPAGTQALLQQVPGVTGVGDDGFGNSRLSIGIRGLNPRRSARILFLEDGIPIQPALYIYPNMYYNPPVERIEEIEVVKGAGAVQFGPHTMGGVINYITTRPSDTLSGKVKLGVGSSDFTKPNYYSTFVDVNGFGGEKHKSGLQVLYKSGDGFRENNHFNQYNTTWKTEWSPNEDRNVFFKVNHNYEKSNATYTGLTEWSYENDPRFNPKENDEFIVNRFAADLISTQYIGDSLSSITKVYFSFFDRDWWREDDVFIRATSLSAFENGGMPGVNIATQSPTSMTDLVRVGNGQSNFGIFPYS